MNRSHEALSIWTTLSRWLRQLRCFLNFNHHQDVVSIEDGQGREFRMVWSCGCGKKTNKSDWTDDNHLMGHGN